MSDTPVRRVAHLTPVLEYLELTARMYERATKFTAAFPSELKALHARQQGTVEDQILKALLETEPGERESQLTMIRALVENVRALIDEDRHDNGGPSILYEDRDVEIFSGLVRDMPLIGSRAKREFARWFEAVHDGDSAFLVMQSIPGARGKNKIEIRFIDTLPTQTLEHLGLPVKHLQQGST